MATNETVEIEEYDVIIVGGGSAGIGAAFGARQAAPEARILLIEAEGCLGGAATHRGVVSYCGLFTIEKHPRHAVGGVWEEIRDRLLHMAATTEKPVRHRGIFQVSYPAPRRRQCGTLTESLEGDRTGMPQDCSGRSYGAARYSGASSHDLGGSDTVSERANFKC